jgi:hypothetical protein
MNAKKIGLLCLALVLALGALGVGYASWTDKITVSGQVCTGNVDLNIIELSSTYIYKVPGADPETVIVKKLENFRPSDGLTWHVVYVPPVPTDQSAILVAKAETTSPGDDMINVVFDNAFPCAALTADFIVHYEGSIPVIATAAITGIEDMTPENNINDCAMLAEYATVSFYEYDDATGTVGDEILGPVQLHYCDCVYCVMSLNIPQDDDYMDLCCAFTAEITATQWNECVD